MEKRSKQIGRPVLSKGKRTKKIDVRFTDDEFLRVLEMERLFGLKRTDIIRKKVLESNLQLVFDAKSLLASIDQVGLELSRSGNNINQLARYANVLNKQRILSPIIFNRYLLELEKHTVVLKSLGQYIKKILRMLAS